MCATASPRHSHHNQFGYARATAVCSSEATTQPERKHICSLNPLQVLQFGLPTSSWLQSGLGGAGGRCPAQSGDSHSSAEQLLPAEKPQEPFLLPHLPLLSCSPPDCLQLWMEVTCASPPCLVPPAASQPGKSIQKDAAFTKKYS